MSTPAPWTANAFLEMYPEFKYAGPMIPRAIADVTARVDADHFGTSTQQVIGLMTAILLASSPFAQTQKLDPAAAGKKDELTKYEQRLEAIKREKRVGFLVL